MKVRWIVAFLLAAFTGVVAAQGQAPTTETALGSVRIPRSVKADGKDLKAGTYQVRLTAEEAAPAAEMKDLMPGPDAPGKAPGSGARVEMLKGNDYLRVWISRAGVSYLIHMPPA